MGWLANHALKRLLCDSQLRASCTHGRRRSGSLPAPMAPSCTHGRCRSGSLPALMAASCTHGRRRLSLPAPMAAAVVTAAADGSIGWMFLPPRPRHRALSPSEKLACSPAGWAADNRRHQRTICLESAARRPIGLHWSERRWEGQEARGGTPRLGVSQSCSHGRTERLSWPSVRPSVRPFPATNRPLRAVFVTRLGNLWRALNPRTRCELYAAAAELQGRIASVCTRKGCRFMSPGVH